MTTPTLWKTKIQSLLPEWMTSENANRADAIVEGMAAMVAAVHRDIRDNVDQTFINNAVDDFLIEHASERRININQGESNASIRARIKNLHNLSSCAQLQALVDAIVGGRSVVVDSSIRFNHFTVGVPETVQQARFFLNNNAYLNGQTFAGTTGTSVGVVSPDVEASIRRAVDSSRVFGTSWEFVTR